MLGGVPSISVEELKRKRDAGERFTLVDVREPHEFPLADLPESVKIPLGTLPRSLDRLSPDDEIVVYCRTGGRSAQAVQFLRQNGFSRASNLAGGLHRWADAIDPTMRKY